jgi:hypothetical protein
MNGPVATAHPQVLHYTTAIGLQGIIENQQLWATNISHLNDSEEQVGFFDRRLPHLLSDLIGASVSDRAKTHDGKAQIEALGGEEIAATNLTNQLVNLIRTVTLKFNSPYVTSFCAVSSECSPDDGLLSQWRGYGADGGYAIVFDSAGIEQLLEEEHKNFHYQSTFWGNVDYYGQDTNQTATHPETLKSEKIIQDAIRSALSSGDFGAFDDLLEPITALSCLHKHSGFREENEVRIVSIPSNELLFEESKHIGDVRPSKPIMSIARNGVLVPYIQLFGNSIDGKQRKLPICRVIVGPHPNKLKRQNAVEVLLQQHGIDAPVVASDIPYLGR